MLPKLQKQIIKNYNNKNNIIVNEVTTFKNILFLKHQINVPLIKIINDPNNYNNIKQLLFQMLNISQNVNDAFIYLENNGLNNFGPLNKNLKTIINTKYNFLFKDIYECNHFKICSNYKSPIFTKSKDTILHDGVYKFIQMINEDIFVPYDVFKNDMNNDLTLYTTNTYLKNILITSKLPINEIILLCKLSNTLINTLHEFLNVDISNLNIDIIMYCSNAKKICPTNGGSLTCGHVNSGSTLYYYDNTYADPIIKIYRVEEYVKVLLHELIHASKFDKVFGKYPKNNFNVETKELLFNESLTEFFARVFNVIIYSHIYNKNYIDILENEINFGLTQTAKILNNFGFVSVEDFLTNNTKKINQDTAAFEYYILTTILLINTNEFLLLIKNQQTIHDVEKLIMNTFNNVNYQKQVNEKIKNINLLNDNNTCKMTITNINITNIASYNKYKQKYIQSKK